jgi:hypothetical protein
MIVKIFSSVVDTSRRVQIFPPSSLPSALMTLASFSKLFAKAFALVSTQLFLTVFFVGIISLCKGIKGCYEDIEIIRVCK